jgi:hypothetical protein
MVEMAVLLAGRKSDMAKRRGNPGKPSGEGKPVRLDPAIASMAKAVATSKGMSLADYLAELLRVPVGRDYAKMLRDLESQK